MNAWARAFRDQLRDEVTVQTRTGTGARGPVFADPVDVVGVNVSSERTLTRDGEGQEVVGELTVKAPPVVRDSVGGTHAAETLLAPGSRITWRGRRGVVLNAKVETWSGRTVFVQATTT